MREEEGKGKREVRRGKVAERRERLKLEHMGKGGKEAEQKRTEEESVLPRI